jgi:2-oxo-3-hexenedioate decarboxylase
LHRLDRARLRDRQSIFPNWLFRAPDTVAAYGLHGRLFIGPRHFAASRREEWPRELSSFEIDLFRNGDRVDHGAAANVLDGPLFALGHLVETLARDPLSPPLAAGEIVTTGTLTRAFPVAAGGEWTTKLSGIPLEGARSLRLARQADAALEKPDFSEFMRRPARYFPL